MIGGKLTPKRIVFLLGVVLAFFLLICLGVWFAHMPIEEGIPFYPGCVIHRFTGLYCPGCGLTRAVHFALNGHLYAALRMNPLMFVLLPALCVVLALARRKRGKPSLYIPTWLVWSIVGALLLFTVLRNIPIEPFLWLAPTYVA